MRVKQCCCGCSLQIGTKILLWLDLIDQGLIFISLAVGVCFSERTFSLIEWLKLGWAPFMLVMVICGIIGVEKHRPSYLLPYIGVNILFLVSSILTTFVFCVGSPTLRMDTFIFICKLFPAFEFLVVLEKYKHMHESGEFVTSVICVLIFCIVLFSYFIVIICSYYKQMQEEDQGIHNPPSGTGYVTYAAPTVRTQSNVIPSAYGQQATTTVYPQQSAASPFLAKNMA